MYVDTARSGARRTTWSSPGALFFSPPKMSRFALLAFHLAADAPKTLVLRTLWFPSLIENGINFHLKIKTKLG